ncbi:GNVR domain-containing protein [Paraburkholderia dilworthii]|uniref:non-specific protein-tyrosine kinase n=2 Tax=Paraburkholderia dilworthii TaxID=948106 RepID=A0ABW9D4Z4_9BURK
MGFHLEQSSSSSSRRSDGLLNLWWSAVRYKRLFGAITAIFVVAGGIYLMLATPQYRAEALLRFQTKPGAAISALSDVSGTIEANPSASDESEVLASRPIVSEAIVQTGAAITVQTETYFPLLGRLLASRYHGATELAPPFLGLKKYAWGGEQLKLGTFTLPSNVLEEKFRIVAAEGDRWTLYDDENKTLAQGRVAQTVSFAVSTADGEAQAQLRVDMLRARPGVAFAIRRLSDEVAYKSVSARLKAVVSSRDSSLREPAMLTLSYQADTPDGAQSMVNTIVKTYLTRDVEYRSGQAQRNLDFLHRRLPGLKTDLEKAENKLNDFRTKTGTIDVDQQGTALISRLSSLEEHQTVLQLALDGLNDRYQPGNPIYKTALAQLNQVNSEIEKTSRIAAKLPSTQREYVRLSRQVAVATQLYTNVLTNSQQLEVAVASTAPGASVVEWAIAPEKPTWPRRGIVLLGSLLGGLFAATCAVHLISLKRRELRTPEDIDGISSLPRLTVVAESAAQRLQVQQIGESCGASGPMPLLLGMTSPTDPSIEALRLLRSSLRTLLARNDEPRKGVVILFTGPTQGVGNSFVASNFAYLLAETKASVLLIDADMRRGKSSQLPERRPGAGLAEVLNGVARIKDVIVRLGGSHLSMLGAGISTTPNTSELLEQAEYGKVLAQLRDQYDFIVIDAPPVLPTSDTLTLAAQDCDLVLVVSRADFTRAHQLEETLRRLENAAARVMGHVFNGLLPSRYSVREASGFSGAKR